MVWAAAWCRCVSVGVLRGKQMIGHAICTGMYTNPSCVTLQVDWQNTFNTLPRDHMLVVVEERCHALLPIAA
jgi:hypothetical protein